jgi:hypothetical protein
VLGPESPTVVRPRPQLRRKKKPRGGQSLRDLRRKGSDEALRREMLRGVDLYLASAYPAPPPAPTPRPTL